MTGAIGILGGTFDPVHYGHLRLALECKEAAALQEIRLVPSSMPPHREPPRAAAAQRLGMLKLATASVAGLTVDDCEIRRGGTSYTIDTVREIRKHSGNRTVCIIMGMDAFRQLPSWKEWELILEQVHIIVADRPDVETRIDDRQLARLYQTRRTDRRDDLHRVPAGSILKIDIPLLTISSTRIRDMLLRGQDPSFLLPDNVIDYIRSHKLYREH